MVKRGFTIVELIIVITIMGILLTVGVINMNGAQANARDAERKSDIEAIAIALESAYDSGYTSEYPLGNGIKKIGQYPSDMELVYNPTWVLRDIDINALKAPGETNFSLVMADYRSTTSPRQTPTKNQYIYQPLKSDGNICNYYDQDCRKFNLYCFLETTNKLYAVSSKHQ